MADVELRQLMAEALRLSTRLEAVTDETYRVARRLADATASYEEADAKAWVRVRFEMGNRDDEGDKRLSRDYEAEARLLVVEEARALLAAKTEDKALDNASRNLRGQLSAVQSQAAALREEMRLASGAGGGS